MIDVSYRCVLYPEVIVPYEENPSITPPDEKAEDAINIYLEHLQEPSSDVSLPGDRIDEWSVYSFQYRTPQRDSLLVVLRIVSEVDSKWTYLKFLTNNLAERVGINSLLKPLTGRDQIFNY